MSQQVKSCSSAKVTPLFSVVVDSDDVGGVSRRRQSRSGEPSYKKSSPGILKTDPNWDIQGVRKTN